MKICAVICEYNPFHSGHLYQLTKVPAKFDKIACIMSGNFVQRAEPAIADKKIRARAALAAGADIVIENPVLYAVANGEKFASGAIKTLALLPDVKGLIMGCETRSPELIEQIADVQLTEDEIFSEVFSREMDAGKSYAAAYCDATAASMKQKGCDENIVRDIISKPNNLLCIEYIKSIRRMNLDIEPVIVQRQGNQYDSTSVYGDYLSATAIRNILFSQSPSDAALYLPGGDELLSAVENHKTADLDLYDAVSLYNLRRSSPEQIARLYDCAEGLEYALYKQAETCGTLSETLSAVKSKRYTFARLKRIVLQLNLGITKEIMKKAEQSVLPFRVIAIKNDFKPYLSLISKNAVIRNSDYDKFKNCSFLFDAEKRASALYATVTRSPDGYYADMLVTDKLI